jgi:hypothetical protein
MFPLVYKNHYKLKMFSAIRNGCSGLKAISKKIKELQG